MRAAADSERKRIVIVTAAQSGKTEMLLDIAGQRLDQKPAPILYVGPNKQFLTEQFEPRVMACSMKRRRSPASWRAASA